MGDSVDKARAGSREHKPCALRPTRVGVFSRQLGHRYISPGVKDYRAKMEATLGRLVSKGLGSRQRLGFRHGRAAVTDPGRVGSCSALTGCRAAAEVAAMK